jgi:hypothetical protein
MYLYDWLSELKEKFPGCINAIKSVDIREYRWNDSLFTMISDSDSKILAENDIDGDGIIPRRLWGGALQLFFFFLA